MNLENFVVLSHRALASGSWNFFFSSGCPFFLLGGRNYSRMMRAIRPIMLYDQVPEKHLVAHARQIALCAVDMLTT